MATSDDISSPDHEGTQWLGCMLDAVVAEQDGRIAGIIYPSRSIGTLAAALTVTQQRFGDSDACAMPMGDACRRALTRRRCPLCSLCRGGEADGADAYFGLSAFIGVNIRSAKS
ncbi:hypothetical protein CR105_21875 [Massilia eurypsychrophila]|uniref:Uncharacterized protein n=1 Tax=Massilia eurypsychrophila TaxID=1485217 RepID=A0A2G8T9Z1_9BURK|nr:hypothetical protein [Massilia eurypsychrophila]PIL42877.1 hypothetical protein CR105_21875 [Massilia eurypsychrophila]